MRLNLLPINECFINMIPLSKVYKSQAMQNLLQQIAKIPLENTVLFVYGETGTEKDYVVKTILKNQPQSEILRISGQLAKKVQSLKSENIIYLIENFENMDLSFLSDAQMKFKCAIFISELDFEILYKEGKINETVYGFLSKSHKIYIPPLRERKQDVIPLALYFLQEISDFLKIPTKELSKEAKDLIAEHTWNGNAYELKQCLAKACILSKHKKITTKDLFGAYDDKLSIKSFLDQKIGGHLKDFGHIKNSNLYDTVIQEVEKALFALALNETGGNQVKASKILGINRNTLNKKLRHYGLI